MDKLTDPLLIELIDVYKNMGTDKNRKQSIKIHYKLIGYLDLTSFTGKRNYREKDAKSSL